ncbi:hypothetical protein GW17_00040457 [Ensete ventricosum]|nr:hypothetical protein GW17_00040457 [Ensete ventricosum]
MSYHNGVLSSARYGIVRAYQAVFDEMLMFVRVLRFAYILCTASSRLAFSTLLDLEGCNGDCIGEESQSSKCICGAEQGTSCSARRSSPKGIVVFETSSGKNAKRKVAPTGHISMRDRS